jgi:hypothetical protein
MLLLSKHRLKMRFFMLNNSKKQQRDQLVEIRIEARAEIASVKTEVLDEFSLVREHAKSMEVALLSEQMAGSEHGEIENFIFLQGTELLRRYVQSALDIRSRREERLSEVIGGDELVRTHVRQSCERGLITLFGEVTVDRIGYSNRIPGSVSLFPLDRELNLPPDKYSHGLRERMAAEVRKQSFDEAVASVGSTTRGKIPKRQAQEVAVKSAQDFEAFYSSRSAEPKGKKEAGFANDLLVISCDGKGIVMRPESLREQTKRANANEKHKLETRLSKGEKRNRKRMAMVATVYDIARQVRTAEGIMGVKISKSNIIPFPVPAVRPEDKRVWASVERDAAVVVREAFEEALRRDPQQLRTWVILVDGQPQQLRYIKACMKEFGLKADLILDFIQVLEYLWKAAYCFEKEGSEAAETWVEQRILEILRGKASRVAAGIRGSATKRGLSLQARKAADTCADYLLKYNDMLRYDQFLENGYPIATGVIEGACRHLIKDRLDITGARWTTKGAEAILKLRSLHSSGDWSAYWAFHKVQELQRNHTSQFAAAKLAVATG